jgi:hypothetical protein
MARSRWRLSLAPAVVTIIGLGACGHGSSPVPDKPTPAQQAAFCSAHADPTTLWIALKRVAPNSQLKGQLDAILAGNDGLHTNWSSVSTFAKDECNTDLPYGTA